MASHGDDAPMLRDEIGPLYPVVCLRCIPELTRYASALDAVGASPENTIEEGNAYQQCVNDSYVACVTWWAWLVLCAHDMT